MSRQLDATAERNVVSDGVHLLTGYRVQDVAKYIGVSRQNLYSIMGVVDGTARRAGPTRLKRMADLCRQLSTALQKQAEELDEAAEYSTPLNYAGGNLSYRLKGLEDETGTVPSVRGLSEIDDGPKVLQLQEIGGSV